MLEYKDFKGDVFVFVGQNASTGTPNELTGRMSFAGTFYRANDRQEAKEFAEKMYSPYEADICKVGTARTLRQYDLGCSVQSYLESLHYALSVKENYS
jgi:hypothetical protein